MLLAAVAGLGAIRSFGKAPQQTRPGKIRTQTDLVTVLASVSDANGRPIPDLKQDAFQISEEGVPQTIELFEPETNRPIDLALMVDSSLSTFKELKFETEAAAHFIRQVVRPGDTLGVFEFDAFAEGTRTLAQAIAASKAFSIAGGGDTIAAINKFGVADGISYISTAGGAFLEFLEGKTLPAVAMLEARAAG